MYLLCSFSFIYFMTFQRLYQIVKSALTSGEFPYIFNIFGLWAPVSVAHYQWASYIACIKEISLEKIFALFLLGTLRMSLVKTNCRYYKDKFELQTAWGSAYGWKCSEDTHFCLLRAHSETNFLLVCFLIYWLPLHQVEVLEGPWFSVMELFCV